MLAAAMDRVLQSAVDSTKFFFVIDGLDELHGSSIDKTHLADLMHDMSALPQVKLLLSSRPESPFMSSFKEQPTLRLENFTRPDIARYVCDKISAHGRDDYHKDHIRRIQDFIIRHARGVFLWVFLTVRIAVDGLNNYEDIRMIRQRIEELPQELDDLFTHILRRIPSRYKKEAFRYLLIVLECQRIRDYWPGLSAQRWDGELVPDIALAVAQRASNHQAAGNLAWLSPQEIQTATVRLRSHLHSRCQGLLELNQLVMQNPAYIESERRLSCVCFLHRTLFDLLTEHKDVIEMLRSGVGQTFDVYRAIMAGWIAYHKSQQPKRRNPGTFTHVHIPIIFRLNALAEESTGLAQTGLLTAIDDDMHRRLKIIFPRRSGVGHWASEFVKDADLLAYTIATGSSLYLREVIQRRVAITRLTMRPLLQFAIPHYSDMESRKSDAINCEAATLLLEHGEDPLKEHDGRNAWQNAFSWITDNPEAIKSPTLPQILNVIKLMAKFADGPQRYRTTLVGVCPPAEIVRKRVLGAECCSGKPLHFCECSGARSLGVDANAILMMLESQSEQSETLVQSTSQAQSRNSSRARSQATTREAWSCNATVRPPGSRAYGHGGTSRKSFQRSNLSQRTYRSVDHDATQSRLGQYVDLAPTNDPEIALYDGGITLEPDMHRGRYRHIPHREDLDNYEPDYERRTQSCKPSIGIHPNHSFYRAHKDEVAGSVPGTFLKKPHDPMTSANLFSHDAATVRKHERSNSSARRPDVKQRSEPLLRRAGQLKTPIAFSERPDEPDVRHRKPRRKPSFWNRLRQISRRIFPSVP